MPAPDSTEHSHHQPAYGNWDSRITTALIVSDCITIDECKQTAGATYFIERRPQQAGRCVIVKHCDGKNIDLLPEPYSARSRVHEYGGGSYCLASDNGDIFFVNDADQDIYRLSHESVTRITSSADRRFADFIFDSHHQRLIAVCEQHTANAVLNSLVNIDISSGMITTLYDGDDFYASPRLNSTSTRLCWQSWNHPDMPWDGNQLWLADIDSQADSDAQLSDRKLVAGGRNISTFQPQWSPDDVLFFISDDTGWWHLYRYFNDEVQQLSSGEKEFGLPQWLFAQSTYAFIDSSTLICCYQSSGQASLALLSIDDDNRLQNLDTPWQSFHAIAACGEEICFIAASSSQFPQLFSATRRQDKSQFKSQEKSQEKLKALSWQKIKTTCQLPISDDYFSAAQVISFDNRHGQKVYANYYAPHNPSVTPDPDSLPPLIVICHGGPSGQSGTDLDPKKQFWTSRGFALLDVNYSGSTGYGREYRNRLDNNWGVLDVQDCCDAALYAVSQGLASRDRLIIRGSSAGGYTVLSALTFEQVFTAGACYYGISELGSLARDSHKFESRYLDRLVGPYPEAETLYRQRSPIYSAQQLDCPVIFFQGLEDKVVPREQTELMFDALAKKGVTVAAQYFENEQHGFRQAGTIMQTLENELNFYRYVFALKPAQDIHFMGDIKLENG